MAFGGNVYFVMVEVSDYYSYFAVINEHFSKLWRQCKSELLQLEIRLNALPSSSCSLYRCHVLIVQKCNIACLQTSKKDMIHVFHVT